MLNIGVFYKAVIPIALVVNAALSNGNPDTSWCYACACQPSNGPCLIDLVWFNPFWCIIALCYWSNCLWIEGFSIFCTTMVGQWWLLPRLAGMVAITTSWYVSCFSTEWRLPLISAYFRNIIEILLVIKVIHDPSLWKNWKWSSALGMLLFQWQDPCCHVKN